MWCILGKLKAKKEAAAPAFNKTDVEEYDNNSDEIVIVTDSDNVGCVGFEITRTIF